MHYICPVCGYNHLHQPPQDYSVCPSCGTEFGYDDSSISHAELRARWIARGAQWWDGDSSPPADWAPLDQLRNIGYEPTDADLQAISKYHPVGT